MHGNAEVKIGRGWESPLVREWAARGETVTLRGPTTSSSGSPPPHQPAGQAATSYLGAQPETTGWPTCNNALLWVNMNLRSAT